MTDRRLKLKLGSFGINADGTAYLYGRAPKGGFVEIAIERLDLDQLRCAQRQIGRRLVELVAQQLAELEAVRAEASRSWSAVNAVLTKEQPK